jgi:hypothetical protein
VGITQSREKREKIRKIVLLAMLFDSYDKYWIELNGRHAAIAHPPSSPIWLPDRL